jgi:predicted dehydrogenase
MIKIGIAGFGIVGQKRKACLDSNPNYSLIAVCDRKLDNATLIDNNVRCYTDYNDLLNEDLDALLVCMSNDMASEVTKKGLEKGLHVFCEKPPARTVKEVQAVVDCESKNPSLKLMYGFNHRYHDSVEEALNILKSGEFGSVINIRGMYGKAKLITFNQPDWRTKRELSGGGVLLDQGIHMVDLIRLFGGDFDDVHSFVSNSHWGYDVEDNAYAIMRSKEGVVAMLNSSATQWRHRFHLEINLEKGSLILGGLLTGTKSYGSETLIIVKADPDLDLGDPKEHTIRYNKDSSWDKEMELFAKYILQDEKVDSGSSHDALETMKLVYRIYYNDTKWRNSYNIENPDQ